MNRLEEKEYMGKTALELGERELKIERVKIGAFLGVDIFTLPAAITAKQKGLSGEEFIEQQISQALELDIEQLELHFDADLLYPGIGKKSVEMIKNYCPGLVYSVHLPFRYVDISCPIERIRSASVASTLDAIQLAAELNPIHYVVHLTGNVFASYKSGLDPLVGEVMHYVEESIAKIAGIVGRENILVENLCEVDFEYFMTVVRGMGLSVCQDIGHIVQQGGNYMQFTREYSDFIKEIHLHDTQKSYIGDSVQVISDHQPIGNGVLDFESFFSVLSEVGFHGSIVLEIISNRELLPKSVIRTNDLINSYLSKKKPNAISLYS